MPLSIAIYVHDLSPGGVERQCLALAKELQRRGAQVTLVVHRLQGELLPLLPNDLPVVDLAGTRTLHDAVRLRRYLRQAKPDILVANVDHNNVAASLAKALAGSRTRTRLVICQHNPLTPGYHATVNWKHRVVPLCYRLLARHIDHAVAVSDGIARELVQIGGLRPEKVSTISNAVIGDDFAQRAAAPAKHPWFDDADVPVFATAGRLVAMKDHRTLLHAFALFRRQRAGRLMILGVGPMREELERLAESLGVAADVAFLGFVQNPLPYMRQASAFVLSSRSEGFGNVLVEAMGCGTPVVATDCPYGPAEILAHDRYGVLAPQQNPSALAAAMQQVLDERQRWPSALLRERAATFSYDACTERYWRLFQRLATARSMELVVAAAE
ncbi:MAG: glycosyltransferase [Acetobacteraceae bacterium]|nr:glycosyltransferase [Pseudomonadota bacterium]